MSAFKAHDRERRRKHMFRRIALSLLVVSLFSVAAFGQASDSATADATARVLTPISIANSSDLNFGSLISGPVAGTVTISPAGARTSGGGVTLVNSSFSAAAFDVSGEPLTPYTITLPSSITIVHSTNSTYSMAVNTFTSNPSGSGTLDSTGGQQLNVGAKLQVGASQPTGLYTGTFNVTVTY
jgi:hypothetical protein